MKDFGHSKYEVVFVKRKLLPLLVFLVIGLVVFSGCVERESTSPVSTPPSSTPTLPTATPTSTPAEEFEPEFGVKYMVFVVDVVDGDTIDVRLPNGDIERVRMLGVDTPEKTPEENKPGEYDDIDDLSYLAEWGQKAKEFTSSALEGKYCYIEFDDDAGIRGYYGRLLAYVYYENGTDFGAQLVKLGYARVYTEGKFDREEDYLELQNDAIRNHRGLWGYEVHEASGRIEIATVHYDASGDDRKNLNDEYVVIRNSGSSEVSLKGWRLVDEAGHYYYFPDVVVPPGGEIRVHTGSGVDTSTDLYWGWSSPIWNNDHDTAYLYNAGGGLVDSYSW